LLTAETKTEAAAPAAPQAKASAPQTEQKAAVSPTGQLGEAVAPAQAEAKVTEKPAGAPEKYDFKGSYDPTVLQTYSEFAKSANLTQEAAQKGLDSLAKVVADSQQQRIDSVKAEWTKALATDKEFGGDKLAENLATANKALTSFGSPELLTLLRETGLNNHPEIIRAWFRAGQAISADGFVRGSPAQIEPNSDAAIGKKFYPNTK
jgi:hypothetical protein